MKELPSLNALVALSKRKPASAVGALRIGLVADTSTQILAACLRGVAHWLGWELELFEAEYDQVDMQVLNPQSELHRFGPHSVLVYLAAEKLADRFGALSVSARCDASSDFLDHVTQLHRAVSSAGGQMVCFNLADPGDWVFGHYANKVAESLTCQIRKINLGLAELARTAPDLHVFDLAALQVSLGRRVMTDPRLYCTSRMPLTPEATREVAKDLIQMVAVQKGGGHKCVILDLDNTLWGGVIGDDGIENIQLGELGFGPAFVRFQRWLKQLRDRGVVLVVCSKNNLETAREPFQKHPDMVLQLDDIAVFVANWQDKASNIRSIREIIDVDYSAIVFLDDNPVERALVRESFPAMTVPELPADPCEYLSFVQRLNLFETNSYTAQDGQRTQAYQAEASRRTEREKYVDEAEFLCSLEMSATVRPFTDFLVPRIAQLTQRSNQFNLRTVRYTESQIETLRHSPLHRTFSFELRDRFGDYGLISVVILERREREYFVDNWLMSCRVLGRRMESFVLNSIAEAARDEEGVDRLVGEYLPTAKNRMVEDHYAKLGFTALEKNRWELPLATFFPREVHIAVNEEIYGPAA